MYEAIIRENHHLTWEVGLFFGFVLILALVKHLNPDSFYRLTVFWKNDSFVTKSSRTKLRSLKIEDVLVFVYRGLVFSAFTYSLLIYWGYGGQTWLNYPTILGAWASYCLIRALLEWGVGLGFDSELWMLHIQLRRSVFKAKLSFVLSVLFVIGVFAFGQSGSHWIVIMIIYSILFLWNYQRFVKPFFRLIQTHLVYFILYICTFEIAPLWLIVKYLKV
jgi:hypothetical protein